MRVVSVPLVGSVTPAMYSDEAWDPFWAACEEAGMIVSFHVGGGQGGGGARQSTGRQPAIRLGLGEGFLQFQQPFWGLFAYGVLERHPALKFVLAESGTGWVPFVVQEMDYRFNKVSVHVDGIGRETRYDFDDNGNVEVITITDPNAPAGSPSSITQTYSYYPDGLVESSSDGRGKTTEYAYDALGRLTTTTFADGSVLTHEYDDDTGFIHAVIDENGNRAETGYDLMNRAMTVTNVVTTGDETATYTSTYEYDAAGNAILKKNRNDTFFRYEYDVWDRPTLEVADENDLAFETRWGYEFGALSLTWLLMSVAMMLPSAAPLLSSYCEIADTARGKGEPAVHPTVLLAGYLTAWLAAAMLLALAMIAVPAGVGLRPFEPLAGTAGAVALAVAGAYQFTGLKDACLRNCRNPFGILFSRWTARPSGTGCSRSRAGISRARSRRCGPPAGRSASGCAC